MRKSKLDNIGMSARRTSVENMEANLRQLGRIIGEQMPPDIGFCLMFFHFGPVSEMTYLSNAERQDMIRALRELAAELESRCN